MSGPRLLVLGDASHPNLQRFARSLADAGAEIEAATLHAGALPAPLRTHALAPPGALGKLRYFSALPRLRVLLHTFRPELLLAYYVTGYGTLATLSGYGPRVMITSGSDVLIAPRSRLLGPLVRRNLSRAALVTAWAPHMAEAALGAGAREEKLFVLPRGIPFAEFGRARVALPAAGQPLRIVSTRKLHPTYRIDRLVRAVAALAAAGHDVRLTLAGAGTAHAELLLLAQQLLVRDRIDFVGRVPNGELPELLARHTVYAATIETDGVSASLLEALAVGLVPVVADHPANRPFVEHAGTGLLLPSTEPRALAAALLQAHGDLALRSRARAAGPTLVEREADAATNGRRYVERFAQLVAEGR